MADARPGLRIFLILHNLQFFIESIYGNSFATEMGQINEYFITWQLFCTLEKFKDKLNFETQFLFSVSP